MEIKQPVSLTKNRSNQIWEPVNKQSSNDNSFKGILPNKIPKFVNKFRAMQEEQQMMISHINKKGLANNALNHYN